MDKETEKTRTIKAAAIISAVAAIVYIVCALCSSSANIRTLVGNIFFIVPIVIADMVIVFTYGKHHKNLMKSMMGFILSGLVMLALHYAFSYMDPGTWFANLKGILFLLIVVFAVNQFLLSNDHYSHPVVLFINQCIMILTAVGGIGGTVINTIQDKENPLIFISLLIFVLCSMFIVLVVEMRVNGFKVKRETAGYTFVKSKMNDDMLDKEDMFISNGLFYSLPWFVLVGLIGLIAFNALFDPSGAITWGYSVRYLIYVIKLVCLVVLVRTYKSHNKNVMKNMLGFLLGMLLFENVIEIVYLSTSSLGSLKSIATMSMIYINIFFLIIHLQLTRTHAGNTKIVKVMKVTYVLYAILTLIVAVDCSVYYILAQGNNYMAFVFKPVLWILGTFPVITGVLTIDTRVNGFKVLREQGK